IARERTRTEGGSDGRPPLPPRRRFGRRRAPDLGRGHRGGGSRRGVGRAGDHTRRTGAARLVVGAGDRQPAVSPRVGGGDRGAVRARGPVRARGRAAAAARARAHAVRAGQRADRLRGGRGARGRGATTASRGAVRQQAEIDIMHHLGNSHTIELPYWRAPYAREIELPRFAPLKVGGLSIDLSPTKHAVFLTLAAVLVALVF